MSGKLDKAERLRMGVTQLRFLEQLLQRRCAQARSSAVARLLDKSLGIGRRNP